MRKRSRSDIRHSFPMAARSSARFRQVSPNGQPGLVIYVENAGDFFVSLDSVAAVHSQKVIFECRKLDTRACGVRSAMPTTPRSLDSRTPTAPVLGLQTKSLAHEVGEAAGAVTA
jgi:hypothetical protein